MPPANDSCVRLHPATGVAAILGTLFALVVLPGVCLSPAASADDPNIVLILADDLGYGDLGCYGHPSAKTPNIDRLAREGVRFTQHYSNGPECSPTRTALLTGRYPQRAGGLECAIGTGNVGRYDEAIRLAKIRQLGLPADQAVIPLALNAEGYVTGVFGKWHLGYEPQFNPLMHGWHEFFGYLGGNVHYFNHRELSDLHVLFRGRLPVYRKGYMTHLITEDSLAFIERHKKRPFFLYVSHECPHFPFQGPQDADKLVTAENWTKRDPQTYVAMLEDLDREVGRLVAGIERAGLTRKTLVIFVSDNGGLSGAAHMGPLRGAKGTTWEGGIRVPLILRWPSVIKANQVSRQVCATFDLTHSLLTMVGRDASKLDGQDLLGQVVAQRSPQPRTLFWRGKRGKRTWSAVRDADLKYVRLRDGKRVSEWLFDLATDIGEAKDLRTARPKDVQRLRAKLERWEADVKPVR